MGSGPHLRKFLRDLPFLGAQGASRWRRSGLTGKRGQMGDVIRLAERREARRAGREGRRRERSRARVLLRSLVPVHVPRRRARRARVRRGVWTPASADALRRSCLADDDVAAAAVRRAAEERAADAAHAARLARALPDRRVGRDARRRPRRRGRPRRRRSCSRRPGSRSAAGSTSTIPRSSPRRPPPRASCSTTACARRATRAATARSRPPGRALLAAGADRLPALRVGRALYWGERRVGEALRRPRSRASRTSETSSRKFSRTPRALERPHGQGCPGVRRTGAVVASALRGGRARSAPLLRGDEPGEDLGVERVDRLGLAHVADGDGGQRRARRCSSSASSRSSSANGVYTVRVIWVASMRTNLDPARRARERGDRVAPPDPGGMFPRHDHGAAGDDQAARRAPGRPPPQGARRHASCSRSRAATCSRSTTAAATEGIDLVDVRHESAAAFAAEGWAKVTREPGVCALTAGPGVTNGMSALGSAQQNHSPMLVLGGRAPAMRWGQGSLQEVDHVPFVRPLVKLAATADVDRRDPRADRRGVGRGAAPALRPDVPRLPARPRLHGGRGAGARRAAAAPAAPRPTRACSTARSRCCATPSGR